MRRIGALLLTVGLLVGCSRESADVERLRKEVEALKGATAATPLAANSPTATPSPRSSATAEPVTAPPAPAPPAPVAPPPAPPAPAPPAPVAPPAVEKLDDRAAAAVAVQDFLRQLSVVMKSYLAIGDAANPGGRYPQYSSQVTLLSSQAFRIQQAIDLYRNPAPNVPACVKALADLSESARHLSKGLSFWGQAYAAFPSDAATLYSQKGQDEMDDYFSYASKANGAAC